MVNNDSDNVTLWHQVITINQCWLKIIIIHLILPEKAQDMVAKILIQNWFSNIFHASSMQQGEQETNDINNNSLFSQILQIDAHVTYKEIICEHSIQM